MADDDVLDYVPQITEEITRMAEIRNKFDSDSKVTWIARAIALSRLLVEQIDIVHKMRYELSPQRMYVKKFDQDTETAWVAWKEQANKEGELFGLCQAFLAPSSGYDPSKHITELINQIREIVGTGEEEPQG